MPRSTPLASVLLVLLIFPTLSHAADKSAPAAEPYLQSGQLKEGETALTAHLKEKPDDDQARFGLGVIQFVRAVEARMQTFHRYGWRTDLGGGMIPLTNLPIPPNPKPEPLDYPTARTLLQTWLSDLARVETTLAPIKDSSVKLPIHFGLVKLDFNGDGKLEDEETLWKIYTRFNRQAGPVTRNDEKTPKVDDKAVRDFVIAFDRGDVDWLRGYCHLLSAPAEIILAHDFGVMFTATGHLLFRGVKTPYAFMEEKNNKEPFPIGDILDAVAMIHLAHFPVVEPARMKSALAHLEAMSPLSRSSWKFILAETDDDAEWIPNPKQGTVMPGGKVTDEMVKTWHTFLDEYDLILSGKHLLPFWRGANPKRGVNLRKIFEDPKPLDIVLWIQGSGIAPFLEEGSLTPPAVWERLQRVFRGEFTGFAIWFN